MPQPVCTGRGSTTHRVPYGAPPEPSHSVLYACAARPRPHRLEIRSPPPYAPALSEAPMALRAGRREAKVEAPRARRAILKPNPFARPPPRGRARPTQAAAPRLAGGPPAATLAASPPAPDDSAGCRHGFRLASTASRSCTQRADAAPAFAVDRSLSGRSRLGCSRRADLGLLRSKTAHGAAGLCVAAPAARSRPVVNGRTERRKIEAASSRRRWTLGPPRWIAAGVPVLPLSGALGSSSAAVSAQRSARATIALAAAELQDIVSFDFGFRGSTY